MDAMSALLSNRWLSSTARYSHERRTKTKKASFLSLPFSNPPLSIMAAIPRVNKAQAMCGYVDGHLSQNGYRFAQRDGPRIEEPLDNPPADGQSHLPLPPPSPGAAGLSRPPSSG